ncbi:hypothetical protein BC829DRAFT_398972 [Chytridium lagenaria]|nr:hypothetical protein BC829DRAFT_398972 [Chytridium lagenaria]
MPLITQRYGKDKVRVVKVSNLPVNADAPHLKQQHVTELTVRVLLMGKAFEPSYAVADNALVVPTDTVKNTIYYLAKKSTETLETIELLPTPSRPTSFPPTPTSKVSTFAGTIVDGRGDSLYSPTGPVTTSAHPHSFYRGGDERRLASLIAERLPGNKMKLTAKPLDRHLRTSITSLTTLPDMDDRIFSTTVEASWDFEPKEEVIPASAVLDHSSVKGSDFSNVNYDAVFRGARQITIDIFANHNSPSVQNTLYRMGEHILKYFPDVSFVHYALPNKHVFGYDLDRFGLQNKGKHMSVYYPVADPSGLITATIGRSKAKL